LWPPPDLAALDREDLETLLRVFGKLASSPRTADLDAADVGRNARRHIAVAKR
jgi:hypothetical protein